MRTWLSGWNRAVHTYIHFQGIEPSLQQDIFSNPMALVLNDYDA